MKTIALTATAVTLVLGTAVFAGPIEDFAAKLAAEGYTEIEVENEDGAVEIEATLNGEEVEFMLDPATGEFILQSAEADGDDEDD